MLLKSPGKNYNLKSLENFCNENHYLTKMVHTKKILREQNKLLNDKRKIKQNCSTLTMTTTSKVVKILKWKGPCMKMNHSCRNNIKITELSYEKLLQYA